MGGEDSLIEIACPSVNSPCILLWHVPLVIPSDLEGLMSFVMTLLAGSTAGFPLHFRAVCALSLVQGLCDSCLAVLHFRMSCSGAFWVFLGSCWELGDEEQGLKAVLYFSVLELSLHLCCSKAAKTGVKTQVSAARSGLTEVLNLAGSGRRLPIGLH